MIGNRMEKYCGYCGNKKAYNKANLYHGTSFYSLRAILASDRIKGSISGDDHYLGVSLTRNPALGYRGEVRITLDTNALIRAGYKFETFQHQLSSDEDEEVLIGDIANLHKYILAIDLNERGLVLQSYNMYEPFELKPIIDSILKYKQKHNLDIDVTMGKGYHLRRLENSGAFPAHYKRYEEDVNSIYRLTDKKEVEKRKANLEHILVGQIKTLIKYVKTLSNDIESIDILKEKKETLKFNIRYYNWFELKNPLTTYFEFDILLKVIKAIFNTVSNPHNPHLNLLITKQFFYRVELI